MAHLQHVPALASAPPARIARQFPPAFNMYPVPNSNNFMLGEHKERPLYAVITHTSLSSKPAVALHSGPAKSFPIMAAVDFHAFSTRMTVTLPALPGAAAAAKEEVTSDGAKSWVRGIYNFEVEVDLAAGRREAFEWRSSSGGAVASLGAYRHGWKLVRLASGGAPPSGIPSPRGSITTDGKEVVAVFARASDSDVDPDSAYFAFLGTGRSGLLGERWAVMVVITGLGILEKGRRRAESD